jgi:hypothetical protein
VATAEGLGSGAAAAAADGAGLGEKKRERTCCFALPMVGSGWVGSDGALVQVNKPPNAEDYFSDSNVSSECWQIESPEPIENG